MAGDAEVKLKFVSDEKALASMEQKLARMAAQLDAVAAAGKKVGQTKVDPFAARMTSGTTGDFGIAAKMSAAGKLAQAQLAAKAAVASSTQELDKQPGLIEAAGGAASRYLAPLALAATAVKLIANEWNNVIDRQQKAGQTAITFEEALGEATLNVGDVLSPEEITAHAKKMSTETGVSPATAVETISLAVKSGGATTKEEAEKFIPAATAAAKLTPRASAEELAKTAGSISDYMARRNVSADQAAGVLLSMQSKSNIRKSNEAMDVFGPVVANMAAQGASDPMIQALGPALTQAISDKTGEMTATATVAFTQSLAEAGESRFKGQKNIPDLMLKYLQTNPEEARDFFRGEMVDLDTGRKLGKPELGRGKAETAFRSIAGDPTLAPNEANASFRKQYEDLVARAVTPEQAQEYYQKRLDERMRATPRVRAERAFQSTIDQNQIEGDDAMRGITRQKLAEALQSAGASDLAQKVAGFQLDLSSGDSLRETAAILKQRAAGKRQDSFSYLEQMRVGWNAKPIAPVPGESWVETSNRAMSELYPKAKDESAEEAAKRLDNLANVLQMLIDEKKNPPRPFDRKGNVENVQNN